MINKPQEHFIYCGLDRDKTNRTQKTYSLQLGKGKGMVRLEAQTISDKMLQKIPERLRDVLEIATYVYSGDQFIGRGGTAEFEYGNKWNRILNYEISIRDYDFWASEPIIKLLSESLSFASGDTYRFNFRRMAEDKEPDFLELGGDSQSRFTPEKVALFSGGVDSFTGAVDELLGQQAKVALVSHQSNTKLQKLQRELVEYMTNLPDGNTNVFHLPVMINKDKNMTHETSQRSRSFLYATLGAVVANMFDINKVLFYENGVVSIHLPFDEQTHQARRTRSTHPKVLSDLSVLFSEITGGDFVLDNPYLWKTKTDVIERLKELHHEVKLQGTRSCADSIFRSPQTHCGKCSQCIDRRFAALASKCQEYDPEWIYALELFTGAREKPEERALAAGYTGFAVNSAQISLNDFARKHLGELSEIPLLPSCHNREGLVKKVHQMYQRHGGQVFNVINTELKNHTEEMANGTLPENCLLSMIGRKEHLNIENILKKQKPKETLATPKRTRKRQASSQLSKIEQKVWAMISVRGLTQKQTAIELGCSPQNISKTLKSAEAKIKAQGSRSINFSKTQKLPEDKRGQTNI